MEGEDILYSDDGPPTPEPEYDPNSDYDSYDDGPPTPEAYHDPPTPEPEYDPNSDYDPYDDGPPTPEPDFDPPTPQPKYDPNSDYDPYDDGPPTPEPKFDSDDDYDPDWDDIFLPEPEEDPYYENDCFDYDSSTDSDYSDPEFNKQQSKDVINLQIIVKSAMSKGFCYLGYDADGKRLIRPIYQHKHEKCCWETAELSINMVYGFKFIRNPNGDLSKVTNFPHKNEDLLVERFFVVDSSEFPAAHMFNELDIIAKSSVEEIFGNTNITGRKYVHEGIDCPSAGVVRCSGRKIKLYWDNRNKRRVKIGTYDFPITSINSRNVPDIIPDNKTLVVLGLGRPFDGEGKFNPKRCYILALRILQHSNEF